MYAVRKILSVLLIMILVPLVSGQIVASAVRIMVTDGEFVRQVVRESDLFVQLEAELIGNLATTLSGAAAPLPLEPAEAAALLQDAIPPGRLARYGDQLIDGMHAWVFHETSLRPSVVLDLSEPLQRFRTGLTRLVETKVAALPVCTGEQALRLAQTYDGGWPPCRTADASVNQAVIRAVLAEAAVDTWIPAQFDVAVQMEAQDGARIWQEAIEARTAIRLALGLISWGWVALAMMVLLLGLLNLDRWYTAFGWMGTPLLIGGGLILLTAASVLLFAAGFVQWATIPGPTEEAVLRLVQSAAALAGQMLRNASLPVLLLGLGGLAIGLTGHLTDDNRPRNPEQAAGPVKTRE